VITSAPPKFANEPNSPGPPAGPHRLHRRADPAEHSGPAGPTLQAAREPARRAFAARHSFQCSCRRLRAVLGLINQVARRNLVWP